VLDTASHAACCTENHTCSLSFQSYSRSCGACGHRASTLHLAGPFSTDRCDKVLHCVARSKTTVLVGAMVAKYKAAREDPRQTGVYRGVFVTASPTLKQQVAATFSKFQVHLARAVQ